MDAELRDRFIQLETKFGEFTKDHDTRSQERWSGLINKLDILFDRKTTCMNEMRVYTNRMVGIALGVPTTIVAIVFAIQRLKEVFGG